MSLKSSARFSRLYFRFATVTSAERLLKSSLSVKITNLKELREEIRSWAIYHYWCKSEFEIAVGGLFAKSLEDFEKIDAYRQIEMNLDRITEYVNNTLRIFV